MELNANPIPARGERNIFCPFYNGCLDYAVRDCWETWNCSKCPHKMTKQSINEREYGFIEADPEYEWPLDFPYDTGNDLFT